MDGWVGGWIDGWMDDGWMDGWMGRHVVDGWMDGWMDGWWTDRWLNITGLSGRGMGTGLGPSTSVPRGRLQTDFTMSQFLSQHSQDIKALGK